MKVLHYATEDCRGGAARAAYYIHHLLLERGHTSRMLVRDRHTFNDASIIQVPPSAWRYRLQSLRRRLPGVRLRRQSVRGLFNYDDATILDQTALLAVAPEEVDVVCLHWITGLLTVRDIRRIHDHYRRPMIWLMNDMQPITGGCHYSLGCDGYTRQCGNCPLLESSEEHDRSRVVWKRKQALLSPLPLVIWSGSSGSTAKLLRSSLLGTHRRIPVPVLIDDYVFRPLKQEWARDILRLPQDKKIILLAATVLGDARKGMVQAVKALARLRSMTTLAGALQPDNVHVAIAGHSGATLRSQLAFPFTELGFVNDSITLALAYQASDVFLCPTMDDEGPMMVTESMMCGTPVAMFRLGIADDLVADGETGYAVPVGDVDGLARGLYAILAATDAGPMRAAARAKAVEKQSPALVMPRIEAAFESLVTENAGRRSAE